MTGTLRPARALRDSPLPYRRKISATERLYLAAEPLAPPFAIQFVVVGEGRIDAAQLQDAVARAAAACPGARLLQVGDEWVDSGLAPEVRVSDHRVDVDALDDDPVIAGPFGGGRRTTEVVLARSGDGESCIVVRAAHAVMDAKGLLLWVDDIFRALRGAPLIGAPDPIADHDVAARLAAGQRPTTLTPARRGPFGPTGSTHSGHRFLWRHRTVAQTAPAAVARVCAALAETTPGPARFMIPVDLRRHDPGLYSTANLSLPLFLDVDPGTDWRGIHAQLLGRLAAAGELGEMNNQGLSRLPAPLARGLLRSAQRLGAHTDRNVATALVSHVGKVSLAALSAPGFTATSVLAVPVHTGLVPLSVVLAEVDGHTSITVSARSGLGMVARLEQLLDDLGTQLTAAGDPPAEAITPALPTVSQPVAGESIDGCFRRMVAAQPEALALIGPGGRLSYRALDRIVDSLALHLADRGVGPESTVAVLAGRTTAAAAAQLAVLRLGAAVLPLDPTHPPARLAAVLDDASPAYLLAGRGHQGLVDTDLPIGVLEDVTVDPGGPPVRGRVSSDQVAYLTYTSGSTGRPKGVPVTHRGVVNLVASATQWWALGPDTRFAHHHTPAADMACAALFTPLMTGGAVVLIDDEMSHLTLRRMLAESGANTFIFTPSLLEVALRLDLPEVDARCVVLGGERLTAGLARRARAFFGPATRIVNSYGPTELTMVCATEVLGELGDDGSSSVPIGRPPVNTPVYVLDDRQRPVAEGRVGELCFGGPQVAVGYLGRRELTAERFVTLPGAGRVYRTGDLGRVADGKLECLGRVDEQVKVRGNRVEPDEVRAALEEHPDVERAAVVGRETPSGGRALVGYLVVRDGAPLATADVREFLLDRVPKFMVPSALHVVVELPLSPNGKLDTSRLPGVEAPAEEPAAAPAAEPAASIDRVRSIWAAVLKIPANRVTPDADFFALGGDSLDSIEMLAQVSSAVVGPGGEERFVGQLEGLVTDMTLTRVHAAAESARGDGDAA